MTARFIPAFTSFTVETAKGPLTVVDVTGACNASITHAHAALLTRLSNLKPPRVTGTRADAQDCQDLADHLASVADLFKDYVNDALGDFAQYAPCGNSLAEHAEEFGNGLYDIVGDCITRPLERQADALAEE